jgi:hypothetical protein
MRIRHVNAGWLIAALLIVLLAGCGSTHTTRALDRAALTPTQTSTMLARVSKAQAELSALSAEIKAVEEQPTPPVTTTETTPPPPPPPPPSPAATLAGLNAGGWSGTEVPDLKSIAAGHPFVVRLDTPSSATTAGYEAVGIKVLADFHGPYNGGGVSALNHAEYVSRVVAFVKANPHVLAIEVLNEPGGSWFWGSSSESSGNRESYGKLVVEVNKALVANFGVARPLELCSWDGGHDSSNAWGKAWSKVSGALAACDAVTNHPYGGTGTRKPTSESGGIYGARKLVEETHHETSKPVDITEVGFPTKGPTGDSLQYTETEQAWALYNFDTWANHAGYIPFVTFYGYRDEKEGGGYGIETHAGAKKKAWTALQQFAAGEPCTVCS